jgi:hypothetical protein
MYLRVNVGEDMLTELVGKSLSPSADRLTLLSIMDVVIRRLSI